MTTASEALLWSRDATDAEAARLTAFCGRIEEWDGGVSDDARAVVLALGLATAVLVAAIREHAAMSDLVAEAVER